MALLDDALKGNLATGLAVGAGAVMLGPTILQAVGAILRPAAKSLIKGSMVFYHQTLAEIGEFASDLVAEAKAELDGEARSGQPQEAAGTVTEGYTNT